MHTTFYHRHMLPFACGFTLIETLIYIALFGLIMLGVFTSVNAIQQSSVRSQLEALLIEDAAFVGDQLQIRIESEPFVTIEELSQLASSSHSNNSRITNDSFLRAAANDSLSSKPSHVDFSFTLGNTEDQGVSPAIVHRIIYITP